MTQTTTSSKQWTVSLKEAGIGLIYAVAGAVLPLIQEALTTTPVVLNWTVIGTAGISAGLVYLGHKFVTPSQTVTTTK